MLLGYDWQTSEVKQKWVLPQKSTEKVQMHHEIQILKVVSLMHLLIKDSKYYLYFSYSTYTRF